ncbi:HD-GYP domain-containing protein [Paenibacillus sp. LjRoot153]|uniref:HD-GYP domain-containing protein n=1 Tax=Paenibacillus sp. LjRoot153 TaxID=3342270 RepID=UPI003ECFF4F4
MAFEYILSTTFYGSFVTLLAFGVINFFSYSIHYLSNISKQMIFREDGYLFAWLASLWVGGVPLLCYSIFIYMAVYLWTRRKKGMPVYPKNFVLFGFQATIMVILFYTTKDFILFSLFTGLFLSIMLSLFFAQVITIISLHFLFDVPWEEEGWREKIIELVWIDAFSLFLFLLMNQFLPTIESHVNMQLVSQTCLMIFVIFRYASRMNSISQKQQMVETMKELQDLNNKLSMANNHVLTAFAASLEKRDSYTAGHSERVAKYAAQIALGLGMAPKQQRLIHLGGLLHDIGKIGIPDNVLNKQGPLTEEEYSVMKQHPLIGEELIKGVYQNYPLLNEDEKATIIDIILYHHERPDGKGYPKGLSEEQIPIWSKIMAVADSFDAMTSTRSYRKAMTNEQAINVLIQGSGTQFWKPAVDAFINIKAGG